MPRTDNSLTPAQARERLTALSGRLKNSPSTDGTEAVYTDEQYAEAVDAVLAPRGWELLKRPTVSATARQNMGLYMAVAVKAALEAKARAEAGEAAQPGQPVKDPGTILGEVVDEGFKHFIDGKFTPDRPVKKPRGQGPAITKMNLNVRADPALRDRAAELCPAKSVELGWTVTPGLVAMAWLFSEYGITEDDQIGVTVPDLTGLNE